MKYYMTKTWTTRYSIWKNRLLKIYLDCKIYHLEVLSVFCCHVLIASYLVRSKGHLIKGNHYLYKVKLFLFNNFLVSYKKKIRL